MTAHVARNPLVHAEGFHLISGVPRSGSTLLSALLRQNPVVQAGIVSPLGSLVAALLKDMSQGNETSLFISDTRRAALLGGLFENFYADLADSITWRPKSPSG